MLFPFRELSAASSQGSDELLSETDRLHKRIIELSEQLEKREYKLMELSNLNSDLSKRFEEMATTTGSASVTATTATINPSVDTVTAEFTHRLSSLEKKFQNAIRERDQLRDQLKSLTPRIPQDVHLSAIEEKDFLIRELKQEGEKLSKQVLQHSTIIKKLRAKEKETDETIKQQKQEIAQQSDEMERLKKSLSAKDDVERNQIDAVNKLASTKIILESENGELRGKLEDLQQKFDALQVSFSATKAELVDCRRKTKELESKSANLESQCADQQNNREKGDQLEKEVQELRERLRQREMATQDRERTQRQENNDLMRRLEESEMRNEELNQQVALATVPLLKQMEGLQATLNARTSNWERQERELVEALARAEDKLRSLVDIERTSSERDSSQRAEIESLEQRIAGLMLRVEKEAAGTQQRDIEMQLRMAEVERESKRVVEEERRAMEGKLGQMEERVKEKEVLIEELKGELDRMRCSKRVGVMETSQQSCRDKFERDEFGEDDLEGNCGGRRGSTPVLSREHSLDGSLTSNQWPLVSRV